MQFLRGRSTKKDLAVQSLETSIRILVRTVVLDTLYGDPGTLDIRNLLEALEANIERNHGIETSRRTFARTCGARSETEQEQNELLSELYVVKLTAECLKHAFGLSFRDSENDGDNADLHKAARQMQHYAPLRKEITRWTTIIDQKFSAHRRDNNLKSEDYFALPVQPTLNGMMKEDFLIKLRDIMCPPGEAPMIRTLLERRKNHRLVAAHKTEDPQTVVHALENELLNHPEIDQLRKNFTYDGKDPESLVVFQIGVIEAVINGIHDEERRCQDHLDRNNANMSEPPLWNGHDSEHDGVWTKSKEHDRVFMSRLGEWRTAAARDLSKGHFKNRPWGKTLYRQTDVKSGQRSIESQHVGADLDWMSSALS